MPQNSAATVQNNFVGGLKTEFTGLNFPENACTAADNTIFTLTGEVTRREGFNYETNYALTPINRQNKAINTYRWNNVGGDGETELEVQQVGDVLYFYSISNSTVTKPLSTQKLTSTVNITSFLAVGSTNDPSTLECQFTDGNGYLFVFHPYCDPFYCTYNAGIITPNVITVQIRDFAGIPEPGVAVNYRPVTLSQEHNYNLVNQGWTLGANWNAQSTTTIFTGPGDDTFTVQSGLSITNGQQVRITGNGLTSLYQMSGTVVSYSGTTLIIGVTDYNSIGLGNSSWTIVPVNLGLVSTFQSAAEVYPSNADVWWQFKDSSGAFSPSTTLNNVTLDSGPAPQGYVILNAFNQNQSVSSGVTGITSITTQIRPKTGTWFASRVWYTGVDSSQAATGDQNYYTWTESIYFSQIVTTITDFGQCYQTNDPTSENLFDLLPSDGGVINIQGSGSIYKLFPIQNGLLVFAANGIWFITGGSSIGFTADDYTITKISSVQGISSTSYVDVLGYPAFLNEEGVYLVEHSQNGLQVNNLALGTILTFYSDIPLVSKEYARGAYNPITFILQWCYRSTNETDITSRYNYDSMLNLNTANKAFYPYSISNASTSPYVHGITYVAGPGGSNTPDPTFKYVTSQFPGGSTSNFTFSEENDDVTWLDWNSTGSPLNYVSNFTTGYSLAGRALTKWQPEYVLMYSRTNGVPGGYSIQGIWDYADNINSGRYSNRQETTVYKPYYAMVIRRHRIRGRGYIFQMQLSSLTGQPFDIMGWAMIDTINKGP